MNNLPLQNLLIVDKKEELQITCTGSPQTNLEQLLPKQLPGLCHGIPPQNLSMKDPRKNQGALPLVALIEQKALLTSLKAMRAQYQAEPPVLPLIKDLIDSLASAARVKAEVLSSNALMPTLLREDSMPSEMALRWVKPP